MHADPVDQVAVADLPVDDEVPLPQASAARGKPPRPPRVATAAAAPLEPDRGVRIVPPSASP